MNKKSIKNFNVKGKKVILRVDFNIPDFNVPINKNGKITNDKRIREALPTINYLIRHGAKIIIVSHLGRPNGVDPKFSLKPIAERLRRLVDTNVFLSPEVLGVETRRMARLLKEGEILMLENVRFAPQEEANDLEFARALASLGDLYCDDAFGTCHREHASIAGITKFLPSCCGLLMAKELTALTELCDEPERPYVIVFGGSKIKDKISLLNHLIEKADKIIIGGAMAYTFLTALGYSMGKSKVEEGKVEFARLLLLKAKAKNVEVLLPIDHVVAREFSFMADSVVFETQNFPEEGVGMDIGPQTRKLFAREIQGAQTIFWNGPMGVFEFNRFSHGTVEIAKAIAKNKGITVVGGGDTAAVVESLNLEKYYTHVSTGGGASLAFLDGVELPGLTNLENIGDELGAKINLSCKEDKEDETQSSDDKN